MKFYLAPLEGLTGYIYRNAYAQHFGGMDKYFTPFIATNQHGSFSSREKQDVLPANNEGKYVVPQILSNKADDFIYTTKWLKDMGYDEVNLNLGCPSGTVVTKGKGSGFLAYPEELEAFLDRIFEGSVTKISIKTRTGIESPEEFGKLLEIYNKYPMEELIIHPRVQKEYYKNTPNKQAFKYAMEQSRNPLCYNGDIFTVAQYNTLLEEMNTIDTVMLGRGILANPALVLAIKEGKVLEKTVFKAFHDQVYQDYQGIMSGERNVLFKMKELWYYMGSVFGDADKMLKKIKKAQNLRDYEVAVNGLFDQCSILEYKGFSMKK